MADVGSIKKNGQKKKTETGAVIVFVVRGFDPACVESNSINQALEVTLNADFLTHFLDLVKITQQKQTTLS